MEPDYVTDEEAFEREMAQNRKAYEQLKDHLRRDCAGKYVAIAFGRLVAVNSDFDEAVAAAKQLQPAPQHFVVFQGDDEPSFEIIEDPYVDLS